MAELSVVVPTYNRASMLPGCVASIRAAGIPAEIVIVDDGSTDDTEGVVQRIADVTYIRQPNSGPATARNLGAANSHGSLLAFLDSDDTWNPGILPRLVAALDRYPDSEAAFADALVGNPTDGFQPLTLVTATGSGWTWESLESGLVRHDRRSFFHAMIQRNRVFLGATVVRRSAFDAIGGFDPSLFGGEDYEFVLRLAWRAPFLFVPDPLANYLKHPGTVSTHGDRMDREFAAVMQKMLEKQPDLPGEERAMIRARRRLLLYWLGYNSYDRGDFVEARQRLREMMREFGPDLVSAGLWAVCFLPSGLVRGLRRLRSRSIRGVMS